MWFTKLELEPVKFTKFGPEPVKFTELKPEPVKFTKFEQDPVKVSESKKYKCFYLKNQFTKLASETVLSKNLF